MNLLTIEVGLQTSPPAFVPLRLNVYPMENEKKVIMTMVTISSNLPKKNTADM